MSNVAAQIDTTESRDGRAAPGAHLLAADRSALARVPWYSRPTRLIVICGIILVVAVLTVTAGLLSSLRDRDLAEKERALDNLTLVLAEQIDRSFQSIELVQIAVIERMRTFGVASEDDFRRQMSNFETHQDLKNRISMLPHIDAVVLTDTEGKLVNFSRSWPLPDVKIPAKDPSQQFKTDPRLTSLVGEPLRSPVTGYWVVSIARKLTSPTGEFLGVVQGVMELRYFEKIFETIATTPGSSIAVLRRDGTLLVRYPREKMAIGKSFPTSGFLKLLANSNHGTERLIGVIDGQERLIAARGLAHYPVALLVTTTVAEALANWKRGAISMGIAALAIGFVIVGAVLLFIWVVGRKLREQNLQRDTALNNMSQGLAMFDAEARLIVCNDRYRQMCNFPPDLVKPGCKLLDLLKHRFANGTFPHDPEEYCRDLLAKIAAGTIDEHRIETGDGRIVGVTIRKMVNGGWVATHEDITERKKSEALVKESRDNLARAEKMARLGYYKYYPHSNEYSWSDGVYRIFGKSPKSFRPTLSSALEMVYPDDRPLLEQYRSDVMAALDVPRQTLRVIRGDGEIIYVEFWSVPIRDSEGTPIGVFGTLQDVTAREMAQGALEQANSKLIETRYAIDQAVTVAFTDAQGNITHVNDKFCQVSGYSREELLGNNHRMLNSGIHSKTFFGELYRQIKSGRVWRGEICNKAKNGSLYWVDTTIVPQLGPDGKSTDYMAIRVDITARKLAQAKISYLASHDELTGIGNRAVLHEKLAESQARLREHKETFAVLLLDLDGFKHVNDTLGHAVGDELLKELARRMEFSLGGTDVLTRLGGDEFAIIQNGVPNQQGRQTDKRDGALSQREAAISLAVRLLEIVSAPFNLAGQNVTVGISIGIALAPEDGNDAGELLQKADLALYRVKSEGRNNFCFFDVEMSDAANERLQLLGDMRAALTRGEFELHYQPIFDAKTSQPCGVEALVRWRHPIQGLLSPDRFIPLAEETGFIEPLGDWILEKACTDAASWPDGIKVAVNLSAVQFRSGKLFDVILCALVDSGLPPERLELEITESVLMQNVEGCRAVVQQLKNIGISIALDDFGTGYSSLSYLTMFQFDKIKIDKSFTQGLLSRADSAAIVASVLTLARGLDMVVTAEGVETKQQFELLRAAGVHQMQGYLFGRPGPLADLNFAALEQKRQAVTAA